MKEKDMDYIAELISKIVKNEDQPTNVKKKVLDLRRDFNTFHYCFEE